MSEKVWFITGVSRGLGRALAAAALAKGDRVVGTTRNGAPPEGMAAGGLTILPLEMGDRAAIAGTVAAAHARHGRLDVVVNNAGYGLLGPVEASTEAETEHLFAVNVFAPVAVIRAALPYLRAQRRGHIVNVASIAALAPRAGTGLYAATKAALEALSVSLAEEVAPLGIWVTVVEPGSFRTDFLADTSIRHSDPGADDYAGTSGRILAGLAAKNHSQIGDPARAAAAILEAVGADEPPLNLFLGSDALERARGRLDRLEDDLSRWETLARGTDFAG